ncbi:hypothetical protein KKF55_03280 [Patescibacteria group bacterium]|nr:hypothetical protein [Patescibacteria group bacterium]
MITDNCPPKGMIVPKTISQEQRDALESAETSFDEITLKLNEAREELEQVLTGIAESTGINRKRMAGHPSFAATNILQLSETDSNPSES